MPAKSHSSSGTAIAGTCLTARPSWRSRRTTCAGICALGVLGSLFAALESRAALDRRAATLSAHLAASQSRLEQQLARLRERERENTRAEFLFGTAAQQLHAAEQPLARLAPEAPPSGVLIDAARQSVALLLVGHGLYDKDSGRPWRLVSLDERDASVADGTATTAEDQTALGASYTTGTGFLIAGNRIVTNRHVAEPWWGDDSAEQAFERGFEPRYTALRAYFPGDPEPVELRVVGVSAEADVAILESTRPVKRQPLKLAPPARHVSTGEGVVVVSYSAGFEALLAKADETVARHIKGTFGDTDPALARALADHNLVRPLAAVGHVGDVLPGRLVYDAATTRGSSGGPVLNAAGEVVAVNYGGMDDFAGVRLGVPVRFVHLLLETPGPSQDFATLARN